MSQLPVQRYLADRSITHVQVMSSTTMIGNLGGRKGKEKEEEEEAKESRLMTYLLT